MNNPNLGRMLRYYRKANKYSVQQVTDLFAQKYGVSLSIKTIYGWENGQSQPSADNLLILCKLYQINNVLESLGYEGLPEQAPLILTAEERELVANYRTHPDYQSAVRKLLDMHE